MSLRRLLFSSLVEGDRGGSTGEKRAGGVQKAGIDRGKVLARRASRRPMDAHFLEECK